MGRDTRKTSPALSNAVLAGIAAAGGVATDIGVVSTPQLHYMVVATNTGGGYGEPTLDGYYSKLSSAFTSFLGGIKEFGNYSPKIMFDGANGVGALAMQEFMTRLKGILEVTAFNTGLSTA